jgi:hypothetical protein
MNDAAVLEGKAYATWAELREPKMDLLKGDIQQAIEWFNEETGIMPKLVLLHPKCQHLAGEAPEDITVQISGMPLAHEVMMATVEKVVIEDTSLHPVTVKTEIPEKPIKIKPLKKSAKNPPSKIIPVGIFALPKTKQVIADKGHRGDPRGRPNKGFPIEKIMAMFADGIKPDDILWQLENEGIKMSRRSLFYIKAGQRQLI